MSPPPLHAALDEVEELLLTVRDDGTIEECNDRVAEILAARDDEPSAALADLVAPTHADRAAEARETALTTGGSTLRASVVTDGGRVPHRFDLVRTGDDEAGPGSGTTDEGGRGDNGDASGVVVVGRRIREGDRSRGRRRDVLDRMTDAFFAVDREWNLTYVNDRARTILTEAMGSDGAGASLVGEHLWEAIPEAVGTTFYEQYHEAVSTQEPVAFESHYEPIDRRLAVRAYPSETGLSIYFRDVTERWRRRRELRERERVLREMYDIVADRDRTFEEQIGGLLRLGRAVLGTDYGALSSVSDDEYVFEAVEGPDGGAEAGETVPLSATNCERTVAAEETLVLEDVERDAPELTDRAGYTDWGVVCYLGAPVFVDGDVYGTLCFYDDEPREERFSEWHVTLVDLMSGWVGYELQRQRANDRLQRRNDQLEQFASFVSHDLRNPLNVLDGSIELAAETGETEAFERCRRAVDRMNRLVEDLLTLARSGDAVEDPRPMSLGDVAELTWESVETTGATLVVESDRTVLADESRLRQLLANLFRNSVEHGTGTGDTTGASDPTTADVAGTPSGADAAVTVRVGALPDGFYVADDGRGVPETDRERVFDDGYTTAGDGTGLGLAIVQEVVEGHGWAVALTEGADGGARFEFTGVEAPE